MQTLLAYKNCKPLYMLTQQVLNQGLDCGFSLGILKMEKDSVLIVHLILIIFLFL